MIKFIWHKAVIISDNCTGNDLVLGCAYLSLSKRYGDLFYQGRELDPNLSSMALWMEAVKIPRS